MADGDTSGGTQIAVREKERMYVLDSNVFMHDSGSIYRFKHHNIFLLVQVIEELDKFKKGQEEFIRNSRETARALDAILATRTADFLKEGISLEKTSEGAATGRLFLQTETIKGDPDFLFNDYLDKADNRILLAVFALQKTRPDLEVILVSKDLNMRTKGAMAGVVVEDYQSDRVIGKDSDYLPDGAWEMPPDYLSTEGVLQDSWREGADSMYRVAGDFAEALTINGFVFSEEGTTPVYARVTSKEGRRATFRTICDYSEDQGRNDVWGIRSKNREQNFALNLLMDPNIHLVTLVGQAGSGKTLLALAAALDQVIERKLYRGIIFTRATVPMGEDIGFLPGTEEEKMNPWMGALYDNLEVLAGKHAREGKRGEEEEDALRSRIELLKDRIEIKSLNFMRGRSINKKIILLDEVQNLTPKQVKGVITRVGPDTKIICLGNLAQIDTPYLTEASCGLAYLVERSKDWDVGGHIVLQDGERSHLANLANEYL